MACAVPAGAQHAGGKNMELDSCRASSRGVAKPVHPISSKLPATSPITNSGQWNRGAKAGSNHMLRGHRTDSNSNSNSNSNGNGMVITAAPPQLTPYPRAK